MANELLRVKNIKKKYKMGEVEVYALRGVDFTLYDGELVVVLGHSGSGKSTLVNIIGGMDKPSAGEVYFGDLKLHKASDDQLIQYRRNEVGFIFQFYNLMPNLTAEENVNLSVQICKDPLDIKELLEKVGLSERGDHFPSQLSGGEQQRVAIARALAKNPTLLLCDEPTGALDLPTGKQILKILRDFCNIYNKTVVIITHNADISQMADRVVYLKDGLIEWVKVNEEPIDPEKVSW
ncbi:ABC transporter, ATP-binding protein [Candidatus Syntrophocurvum alkaliphilum]|uniref:ABC transporter, ATP-binding protein n=1 Tax=Candidatus Syntrophocurvum alkaliphilum TaxID=2293317 RepID=A0A6I6D609_9FIRM|nr:ABC transporter ATP-binding protein [Candidatus Syntrophocurvum alkaliphilum]QGT98776.1 ABC transporter, ATP-binding protein [Candidatus Syntrophocurvum alkaliphilum]